MRIEYGNGGWIRVTGEDLPGSLYLRLRPDERGRWTTRELYLEGEWRSLVAGDLRELPLTGIEAAVDPDKLASNVDTVAPDLSILAAFFATTFGTQAKHWVAESFRAQADPSRGAKRPHRKSLRAPRRPRRLQRPDGAITTEYLEHVSAAYTQAVLEGDSPAKALAEQAGVPIRTVHRWVYLARLRGVMQPGRPGRVT